MAVLSGATASGRVMYDNTLGTSSATLYTAPGTTPNVTSPSATAYIKEILVANIGSATAKFTIAVNGNVKYNAISVGPNDTKVLSGLNTFLNAGATITGFSDTASAINVEISGVEVQ